MNQTERYLNFFFKVFLNLLQTCHWILLHLILSEEEWGKPLTKKLVEFVTHKKHIQQGLCEG